MGFTEHWIERRPVPLVLTDTEIVEFMIDNVDSALWCGGVWEIDCDYRVVSGYEGLRETIGLAAAYVKEDNQ